MLWLSVSGELLSSRCSSGSSLKLSDKGRSVIDAGKKLSSQKTFRSNGQIPVTLNPDIIFCGVAALIQAFPMSSPISYIVIFFLDLSTSNCWHYR